MISMQEALNDAQSCTSGTGAAEIEDRKHAWAAIVEASKKPEAALVEELSTALKVDKITVRRWILGANTPRAAMFDLIRQHFGVQDSNGSPYSTPVPFDGSSAAIWTLQQWIESLQYADAAFICRGMMKFLAVDDTDLRNLVEHALNQNAALKLYYVVAKGSLAEGTYDRMIKSMGRTNPDVMDDIRKIVVPESGGMGLGNSVASPFIVRFRDDMDTMKITGRNINILYEVPVDIMGSTGKFKDPGRLAYIQLPVSFIDKIWPIWSPILAEAPMYDSNNKKLQISTAEKDSHFGIPDVL